jgi:alpha-1,2-mannosyltransferase
LGDEKNSPLFRLWLLVAAFCLAWAEVGRLHGVVSRPVLEGLTGGATWWWDLPAVVHFLALAAAGGLIWFAGGGNFRLRHSPGERILAVAVVLLGVFLCLNQFGELQNAVSRVTDFGTLYRASTTLFSAGNPYAATAGAYFYPPLLAFFFGVLTIMPVATASVLFFSLKFVMLVWTLVTVARLVGADAFTGGRRALFLFGVIFVACRFWIADLQYGNTNVVILWLVIGAIAWDQDDRSLIAGLALALAVSIKIVPVVLALHFLILGRWRTLGYFAIALVVVNLLPWLWLHGHWTETWSAYFDAGVTGKLNQRLAQPDNQSLWGLINRLFPDTPLAFLRGVWLAAGSVLGLFAGWVSWKSRTRGSLAVMAAAAIYPLVGLLVSPRSCVVHFTAVLLPMSVLWMLALSGRGGGRWAWPLLVTANVAFTVSGWTRATVHHLAINQSWFLIAALLLAVGLGFWVLVGGDRNETC